MTQACTGYGFRAVSERSKAQRGCEAWPILSRCGRSPTLGEMVARIDGSLAVCILSVEQADMSINGGTGWKGGKPINIYVVLGNS